MSTKLQKILTILLLLFLSLFYWQQRWSTTILFLWQAVVDKKKCFFYLIPLISRLSTLDITFISLLTQFSSLFSQYALRLLVKNSATMFTQLVEAPCQCCLECEDDFQWGFDFINSPFRSSVPTIFALQMQMNDEGAYYSTDPDLFPVNIWTYSPKIMAFLIVSSYTENPVKSIR